MQFHFSDPTHADYDPACDPKTYTDFDENDVNYYLHVFERAADQGDTAHIHSTRCAEIHAMLTKLKGLM